MKFGNGRLDATAVKGPFTLSDTTQPCLALQWAPNPVQGEKVNEHRHAATVAINPTGASGSKVLVTLVVKRRDFFGADLADLTYAISGAAAKTAWTSTTASGTASAATLKDAIDLINELPGFKAWALHAPHNASLNNAFFIALTATNITTGVGPEGRTEILHRDVSDYVVDTNKEVLWARISLPEERDANAFELMRIQGKVTGATAGEVKLYRDNYAEYGTSGEVYVLEALVNTNLTKYADYTKENAPVLRGPCILEVKASDLTVADFSVHLRQASIGA